MSFGNKVTIREDLLERSYPLIEKLKGNFTVLHFDIQLQQLPTDQGMQNCWAVIVVALGALVGEDNHLCYTYTMTPTPKPPNDQVLEAAVRDLFQRLGIMRVRQMQQGQIGNSQN